MARIMLAEDDDAMRSFLAAALGRAGHDVASFADGLGGVGRRAERIRPADRRYRHAGHGRRGARAPRAPGAPGPLRVMFITGFAAVVLDGGRSPLPGASVLSKPFHLKELVNHVDRLLAN